jgi:tetratricopeptide (TPR) repeat protein
MGLQLLGLVLIVMGFALAIPGLRTVLALSKQHRRPNTIMLAYWDMVGGAMSIVSGLLVVATLFGAALPFFALFLLAGWQRVREVRRCAQAQREAAALWEQVQRDGDSPELLNRLGYWYREAGMLDAAENTLRRSLALGPETFGAHLHLGNVYFDTGRPEQALEEYIKAQALNPKNPGIEHNIGMVEKKLGRR